MSNVIDFVPKARLTMDDMYGDGSECTACENCGLCISCEDCKFYGCGSTKYKSRTRSKHQYKIRDIKKA